MIEGTAHLSHVTSNKPGLSESFQRTLMLRLFVVLQARYCEDLGIAQDLIVWLYSCIGLTSLLARVPGSRLCDLISPQRVFVISVTVSAVSSILLPFATDWIRLLCFAIVYGLADGLMAIGVILSCMQTLTQKQKAQGYGFFQLFICTALLCGPPIGGKLAVTLVTNEWIARCTLPRSIAHDCYIAQCANPCYDIACNFVGADRTSAAMRKAISEMNTGCN